MAQNPHNAESTAEGGDDPNANAYSALPEDGTTCLCGDAASAHVVLQRGVTTCDACGTQVTKTITVPLCDMHNDLRMQGIVNGTSLLLAAMSHNSGALAAMPDEDRLSTIEFVFSHPDPENAERIFASDASGVRMLSEDERAAASSAMRQRLVRQPAAPQADAEAPAPRTRRAS